MTELISIIIPIYKVEDYLDRCIESAVGQTYKNIQIILVDDGSPDRCPQICDEWQIKDDRIIVIHKDNGGLSSARNKGIQNSTGEYILFIDSDDYIELDACEKLMSCAKGVDLVVGEATIYENGSIYYNIHTNLKENHVYTGVDCAIKAISRGEWFAPVWYNMYKRDFILSNNLFFEEGTLHEDMEYLPRIFLAAKTVKYIKLQFYNYIIRQSSICGSKTPKHLNDLMRIYEKWKKLNDTILDDRVRKKFAGALSKHFIATCREYHVDKNIYVDGINSKYLIYNALNIKEFVKTIAFILFRKIYVML